MDAPAALVHRQSQHRARITVSITGRAQASRTNSSVANKSYPVADLGAARHAAPNLGLNIRKISQRYRRGLVSDAVL